MKPDFLPKLFECAEKVNADIVRGSFSDFNGNDPAGWITDFNTETADGLSVIDKFLDMNVAFVVWPSLYRLDFIRHNDIQFTPDILLEDCDFTVRAFMVAKKIATISDKNYLYRIRPGSILTTNNVQEMSDSEELIIFNFLKLLKRTNNDLEKEVIIKAIYGFMRDWTRIVVTNKIQLDNTTCFYEAVRTIRPLLLKKKYMERIKMCIKIVLIIVNNKGKLNEIKRIH